jgi:hypothetical protein
MKHSAIAGLFITAALLASPVFAADKDLCENNIKQIKRPRTLIPPYQKTPMTTYKQAWTKQKQPRPKETTRCLGITGGLLENSTAKPNQQVIPLGQANLRVGLPGYVGVHCAGLLLIQIHEQ